MSENEARPRRRWLRWVALGVAVVGVVVVAASAGTALYFSNARIRQILLEELGSRLPPGTVLELEVIEVAVFGGVELRGIRIGPPPGFTKDVLQLDRLAIHWSLWGLLAGKLRLGEVAIEGLRVVLETTEVAGSNVEVVLAALVPPSDEADPVPAEPISQPSFPIRIEAPTIRVRDVEVEVLQPGLQLRVDRIGLTGAFVGDGDMMDLETRAGLGDPHTQTLSTIEITVVADEGPPLQLHAKQRLDVKITSKGLGDIQVTLENDTKANVRRDRSFPPLRVRGELALSADLLRQQVKLNRCEWRIGDHTELHLTAGIDELFSGTDVLRLSLAGLRLRSQLEELTPMLAIFVPDGAIGGVLSVEVDPIQSGVDALATPWQLPIQARVGLSKGHFASPIARANDVELRLETRSSEGIGTAELNVSVASVAAAGQRFDDVNASMSASGQVGDWLARSAQPRPSTAQVRVRVRRAGSAEWQLDGARAQVDASALASFLLNGHASDPARARVRVDVAAFRAAAVRARDIGVSINARSFDLLGKHADATVDMDIAGGSIQLPDDTLEVPAVSFDADLGSRGRTYIARKLSVQARELINLRVAGRVTDALTPRPRIEGLSLRLEPIDVAIALAILPESIRPPVELEGTVAVRARGEGVVPYAELARDAEFPRLDFSEREIRQRSIRALVSYVEDWSTRFSAGLPFQGMLEVAAQRFGVRHPEFEASGINLETRIEITRSGPRIAQRLNVESIEYPERARAIDSQLNLEFDRDVIRVGTFTSIGLYERAELGRPVEGAGAEVDLVYRFGGDLLLNRLAVQVPDRPAEFTAEGLLIKPARFALSAGWEKPGLPGLEAQLRWGAKFASEDMVAVAVGAPAIRGAVEVGGSLSVADGVLALAGILSADEVSLRAEQSGGAGEAPMIVNVERVSGQLPFDARLAVFDHPDGTQLAVKKLPFGGGRLELITSDFDIRKRPARPVHFARLLPYQSHEGLTVDRIAAPHLEIEHIHVLARVEEGVFAADEISFSILGGDVVGEMALQLSRENELLAKIDIKTSNTDWSNIPELNLKPGPAAELSANIDLDLLLGDGKRDPVMNASVTEVGDDLFSAALGALNDPALDAYQASVGQIAINEVAVWIRHEALNMDLDYSSIFLPVRLPREMQRRRSLSDNLDIHLQPWIDEYLGPALGWSGGA